MGFNISGETSSVRSPPFPITTDCSIRTRAAFSMSYRRLPIYLLLDCSTGLSSDSLQFMQTGLDRLIRELQSDPHALESVYLSVIAYGGKPRQLCPLTPLTEFKAPMFKAPMFSVDGDVVLGDTLAYLSHCICNEVQSPSETVKGDWKPLTFLLMANAPTDSWHKIANQVPDELGKIVACVVGSNVDVKQLDCVASAITQTQDFQPVYFESYLKWMSQTISNEIVLSRNIDGTRLAY